MKDLVEISLGKNTISFFNEKIDGQNSSLVLNSWISSNFNYIEENSKLQIKGLRPPQIGGIFAPLAHERTDNKNAATIVMPTGTGKTETILSIESL